MNFTNIKEKREAGFTLLELLIVIAIIAILSIALVFMLNPAETLKKARDAQRIADLNTIQVAIGVMLTTSSTPSLDNFGTVCITSTDGNGSNSDNATPRIRYSSAAAPTTLGGTLTAGTDAGITTWAATAGQVGSGGGTAAGKVDGTGWIPVNLKALTGGTPINSFPVDPVNTVAAVTPGLSDLAYRYACQNGTSGTFDASKPAYVYEVNAVLESNAYTVEDNKMLKDGGDNDNKYESGNSLNLLPITGGLF